MKQYRKDNKTKAYERAKAWSKANPERDRQLNQQERDRLKLKVLSFYGLNGVAKCVICGFDNIHALCLDHINDNGADERRLYSMKRTSAGTQFYRWVKKQGFKPGYQTLCYNCNMVKEVTRRRTNARNNDSIQI